MIDAFLYGKQLDPRFGVTLKSIGKDFGYHESYITDHYLNKRNRIPVYEVQSPNADNSKVLPFDNWAEAEDGVFRTVNGYNVNAAGHMIQGGRNSTGLPRVQQQDIWKFHPKDYKTKWIDKNEQPSIAKNILYQVGLHEINRLGTPVITRTKWINPSYAEFYLKYPHIPLY